MKICAILVTYQPCMQKLNAVITSLASQVDYIVLVDNTPNAQKSISSAFKNNQYIIFKNNANIGLSKAQNIGIQWAINHSYDYVLILDQDSVPAEDMIDKLVEASQSLKQRGVKVAAVGPRYGQIAAPTSSFLKLGKYRSEHVTCDDNSLVECSFLISSGMLISSNILADVGMMDESFFIDHIDTEWCFKASSKGYTCYGVGDAYMTHELGEYIVKIKGGRERNISLHHPFRLYYIFRNSILLYKRFYMPMRWKIFDAKRLMFFPVLYLMYSDEKWKSLKYMMLGFFHGILGQSGKLK